MSSSQASEDFLNTSINRYKFIFKKNIKISKFNILTLILPNALSIIYFGFIASPVYVSDANIIIRNPVKDSTSLETLLSGNSSYSMDGAYILKSFINSWDEYKNINNKYNISSSYSTGDFFARYGGMGMLYQKNDISGWHYYQKIVNVDVDERTGLINISVKGFNSDIAYKISKQILSDAILHLNSMNMEDEKRFSNVIKTRAHELLNDINQDETKIKNFREVNNIYNPTESDSVLESEIEHFDEKKIDLYSHYKTILNNTPNNPSIYSYKIEMDTYGKYIKEGIQNIDKLDNLIPLYNSLILKRDIDVSLLKDTEVAMQEASFKSEQNSYSINIISAPSHPGAAELPNRLYRIIEVGIASVILHFLLG
ncbi:hypothetical protein [Acetobacter thailandicus]|uniref:hypothetical protein n=1 Tax=Acetobacter thailandicus TaxID=1502842 RepID=UPI001BA9E721|nr:hypothetical protein [Acetobacter thailandicus]MBS0986934.1 hypothetical protein [Acetobacter thailandicus]